MKFEINNRFSGELIFSVEAENWRFAVEAAIKAKADLSGANLSWADLSGADLSWADLSKADLSKADLSWADLSKADLSWANLSGADLSGADLSWADLSKADLSKADLSVIKNDFHAVLLRAKKEVPELRKALVEGRVNGSTYEGECACLVGTIANVIGCEYNSIPGIRPDSWRPAERFFLAINKGDTPEKNQCAKLAVEWIDEFYSLLPEVYGGKVKK